MWKVDNKGDQEVQMAGKLCKAVNGTLGLKQGQGAISWSCSYGSWN